MPLSSLRAFRRRVVLGIAAGCLACAGPLAAQAPAVRPLSLEEALRTALANSEQVRIARAGVVRARGLQFQARSALFPQLNGSFSYARTLASQFSSFNAPVDTGPPPPAICVGAFEPDPSLPVAERLGQLEQRLACPAGTGFGGLNISNLGFGRENIYNLGLSFAQPVFTGGRISGQRQVANAGRSAAEVAYNSAAAQLRLDVTQAYYDAQLADRLLQIAEATFAQADSTQEQVQLQYRVGTQSEFELLRARVTRDNQRPVVIQQQANLELARLRLKQLLNLPLEDSVALTTNLEADTVLPPSATLPDTATVERAPVRQAAAAVLVQQGQLRVSRSQRLPNLSLTSQYGRVAYPSGGLPSWGDFRTNWTVGLGVQVPIFTGGRIYGDVLAAEASLAESRAQLSQTRELAALDTRNAYAQLRAALASWEASTGTVEQARRAYDIAGLRYREGISTQLELADSRLQLQQSLVNRAQAARNLQVARTRVELLPELPIGTASGIGPGANAGTPNSGSGVPQQGVQGTTQTGSSPQGTVGSFPTSGTGFPGGVGGTTQGFPGSNP